VRLEEQIPGLFLVELFGLGFLDVDLLAFDLVVVFLDALIGDFFGVKRDEAKPSRCVCVHISQNDCILDPAELFEEFFQVI
jgi:hypothetical protein